MKETLKVTFVDFWPEIVEEDIFTPILEKYFNVVVDDKNPDVVFHSIFGGMKDISKYPKAKKILFLGENRRPKEFKTDYSISFDPQTDKNFRLPLWQYFILLRPHYKDKLFNRVNHKEFDRFCSFTVSNPGNFMRNSMFQQLNSYKNVHSYGRYLTNNQGLQKASQGKYWRDAKEEFFNKITHKFALVYENNPYPYYTTEKLMDGFLAGSLPIYWGDPKIGNDFNEKSFINAQKLGTKTIDIIKDIDRTNKVFEDMYSQPIFTNDQKAKLKENLEYFEYWLINKIKK